MKQHVKKPRGASRKQATGSPSSRAELTPHPLCDERLTALPTSIDIAALATLYNSQPKSHVAHEYLLEEARRSLLKYELAQADLELAADSLARAMHLLIEQHGLERLPPEDISRLERDILEWYNLVPPRIEPHPPTPITVAPETKNNIRSQQTHRNQASTQSHGTPLAH